MVLGPVQGSLWLSEVFDKEKIRFAF